MLFRYRFNLGNTILDRYSSRYQAIKMDFRWENKYIDLYLCLILYNFRVDI